MDKDSKRPHSQPSAGSSRRGSSRSVGQPSAQANAVPGPSTNHPGQAPGWNPQQHSIPPNGPQDMEEVARALRTIQDAYPFLVQSVAYHQQNLPRDPNHFPSAVPPQLLSRPPWPPAQPSASHGVTVPQYPPGLGPHVFSGDNYSPANASYPTQQPSTPITTAPGESSFQAIIPQESAPVDAEAIAEEKRRRNTAASARFRVNKKIKSLDLERTVSDLTGRVDDLEQEAADLRRENGWLKDIVMLKSGRARFGDLVAGPSQPASSQGAQRGGDEEGSVDDDEKES